MNEALDVKSDTRFGIRTLKLVLGDYLLKMWNGLLFDYFLLFVIFEVFGAFGAFRSQGKSTLFLAALLFGRKLF